MKKIFVILLLFPFLTHAQLSPAIYDVHLIHAAAPGPIVNITGSFSTFTATLGSASSAQNLAFNGTNLTGAITFTDTAGILVVSLTGSGYGSSVTTGSPVGGLLSGNIYAEAPSTLSVGTYTGYIKVTSSGAATVHIPYTVVVSAATTLSASPSSESGMVATVNSAGTAVTIIVSFANLTGVVTATMAGSFEGSANGGSSYAASNTFSTGSPYSYLVRIKDTTATGSISGSVTFSTPGVSNQVVTLSGTISNAVTLFAFSRTIRPMPTISGTTIQPMVGDPYDSTITRTANGITCAGGASSSSPWQAFGSPLAASNDSLGMLGSTMPGGACPDSILYRGWFTVSGSGRLADSTNQTLAKPNLTFTGLTVGHTYTIKIYSSINTRYSGFHSNVHVTLVGSTTQTSSTLTLLSNTGTVITFTALPDGTGTMKGYFFCDGASTSAINGLEGWSFQ